MFNDTISLPLSEIDEMIEMARELEAHHAQGPDRHRHLAIYAGRIRNVLEFARTDQGPFSGVIGKMPLRPHSNGARRSQGFQMQAFSTGND